MSLNRPLKNVAGRREPVYANAVAAAPVPPAKTVAAPDDANEVVAITACVAFANSVIVLANVPAVIRACVEATVDANVIVPEVVPAVKELMVTAWDATENEIVGDEVNPEPPDRIATLEMRPLSKCA
jgi:hypothetical protein